MIAKQFRQLNVNFCHLYFMKNGHDINCCVFKSRECTKKFLKIIVDYTTTYQVTVQKSIYTVPSKMKNFHDLSPMPIRFEDDISQTGDSLMGSL